MADVVGHERLGRGIRRLVKRAGNMPGLRRSAGSLAAGYMRFVRGTSSFAIEPANPFDLYRDLMPFILSTWHGQQLMVTYLLRPGDRVRGLVSKSRDGDTSAAYLGSFGMEIVRGSGGRDRRYTVEKGGVRAFLLLKKSLEEGVSVGTVADVSNTVARHCGAGIIALARLSGRPILPLGFATSRWFALRSWDSATIHLPFSRGACSVGAPIFVPREADEAALEAKRLEVENALNAASDRAYAMVGKQRDWKN